MARLTNDKIMQIKSNTDQEIFQIKPLSSQQSVTASGNHKTKRDTYAKKNFKLSTCNGIIAGTAVPMVAAIATTFTAKTNQAAVTAVQQIAPIANAYTCRESLFVKHFQTRHILLESR
jgi:hypothetical protein